MATRKSMSLVVFAVLVAAFGLLARLSSGAEAVPQISPENGSPSDARSANITDEKVLATPVDPSSITVDISVSVTSVNPPVIQGTTNLPDGTTMQVLLKGDMPACFPRCGFASSTTVKSGRFTVSAELTGAEKLMPDSYTIEINVYAGPQPHDVQSVIGKSGEHLRGPYVFSFVNGKLQPLRLPWNPTPSSEEYFFGLVIHYTQRIVITAGGNAFLIEKTGQKASRQQGRASDLAQDGTVRKTLAQLGDNHTLLGARGKSGEQSQAKENPPGSTQLTVAARAVPPLRASVTDLTGTLSSQQLAGLDQTLATFQARKGSQIAVLIVPTTKPETIEQYVARVEESWELQSKGVERAVLVLVAKNDHKLRIGVSPELKNALPDVVAKRIAEEDIAPRFKQDDFYGGIRAGIERITNVLSGGETGAEQASNVTAIHNSKPSPSSTSERHYWYFCKSAGVYYPYVTRCGEPWETVDPATGRQVAPSSAATKAEAAETATKDAAQKRAEEARHDAASVTSDEQQAKDLEIARRTQAHPSPVLLAFEAKIKPFYGIQGQAGMAYGCGLRSWQWNVALMDATEMAVANEAKKFKLSHEDILAVRYEFFLKAYDDGTRGLSCETLVNSPTMEKLDRLQDLATGGYH